MAAHSTCPAALMSAETLEAEYYATYRELAEVELQRVTENLIGIRIMHANANLTADEFTAGNRLYLASRARESAHEQNAMRLRQHASALQMRCFRARMRDDPSLLEHITVEPPRQVSTIARMLRLRSVNNDPDAAPAPFRPQPPKKCPDIRALQLSVAPQPGEPEAPEPRSSGPASGAGQM